MKVNFDFYIDIHRWAEACGYKIREDKIVKEYNFSDSEEAVKEYNLSDFEEAVKEYIETELEFGSNQNTIEENFMVNDARDFIEDFEYEHEEDK